MLVKSLKALLQMAGFNPANFSGHSFRRGAATDSFSLTNKHDQIQLHGDWISEAYLRYNEVDDDYRLELPTLMAAMVAAMAP
jgi:hypothetical protein